MTRKEHNQREIQIEENGCGLGPTLRLLARNVSASWETGGFDAKGWRELRISISTDVARRPWGTAELKLIEHGEKSMRETFFSLNDADVIALRDWCNRIIRGASDARRDGRVDPS